jgi:hypothetical protein
MARKACRVLGGLGRSSPPAWCPGVTLLGQARSRGSVNPRGDFARPNNPTARLTARVPSNLGNVLLTEEITSGEGRVLLLCEVSCHERRGGLLKNWHRPAT